ncbi:hypothetical protein MBLNU459_g4718t2 [Dothideomycetes sp. NU459]
MSKPTISHPLMVPPTPTLLSPLPSPVPDTLSSEINVSTRPIHTRLNKLITTRLPLALPPHSASPELYALGVNNFGDIYLTFENCWQFCIKETQKQGKAGESGKWSKHENEIRQWLCELVPSGLWRTKDVQDDLETLEQITGLNLDTAPNPELLAFTEHIYQITKEKPHVLVAYAWIMYMAIFSGGRWIRQQLLDAGPEFWGIHHENGKFNYEVGRDAVDGFSIFYFEGREDGEDIKADFKKRLERADQLLTPAERIDIIAEAQTIFESCISIVEGLDRQLTQLGRSASFDQLKERRLGIDAEDYINNILTSSPTKEPLLPALGGLPFALEEIIKSQISILKDYRIEPFFVFNGLKLNGQEDKLQTSLKATKSIVNAWELYNASEPERAVAEFGNLCTLDVDHIYRATAQLASIEGTEACDAVAGSSELFMFDIEQVITKLDFEQKQFTWVTRRECIEGLGLTSPSMFADACLLAGSSILPTLPQLENDTTPPPRAAKIKAAAELLKRLGPTGNAICLHYQDDPLMQSLNYPERYRKAFLSIKHHVVLRLDGTVETLNSDSAPGDVHALMGQRLPDELFGYLSTGAIGPQVLNWRASGEIVERPPLDGGEADSYQKLVRNGLVPLHAAALSLLSNSLHRFYQHNDITLRCWFDNGDARKLNINDVADPKIAISGWNVRSAQIGEQATKLERNVSSLAFAVDSLQDAEFAKHTITPKGQGFTPIKHGDEIGTNALWRFLQLRDYIQDDHTLSPLGKCLQAAYTKTGTQELEEPVVVALELLRLNALNINNMFPYNGAPQRGSEIDKRNTLLVSRVACLGRLQHKSIGFTGPLSRHLLGFKSMASAVRSSLRNLAEMSLCSMLVNAHVDRLVEPLQLLDVSLSLPFLRDVDCALGIAVKSYLDELAAQDQPTSAGARASVKAKGKGEWFPHAVDFAGDLEKAFTLWDAVYAAVVVAPNNVASAKDKKMWEEVNAWLADRR